MNLITQALAGFALAASLVTAAVTHSRGADLEAGKVTVWSLDIDDPQDNIPFRYPHPFPTKEVCEAFIASPTGQQAALDLRVYVLSEKGPDYKLGEPPCRPHVMDRPSQPGIDI